MHLKLKAFGTTKQITCLHYHFMYIFCFVFEKKVAAPQSRIFFIINTFLSSNHTWVLPLPSALCLFPPHSYAVDKRAKLCFLLGFVVAIASKALSSRSSSSIGHVSVTLTALSVGHLPTSSSKMFRKGKQTFLVALLFFFASDSNITK